MSGSQPNLERILAAPAFPDDDGAADPLVTSALAGLAAGETSYAVALAALRANRLLVPVVALLGEVEYDDQGLAHDKTSDMAAVVLTGKDGRLALLAFTSLETLQRWDPEARPVPVATQLAAQSALQNDAAALLVDVAGPHTFVLEGEDLVAVAQGWALAEVGGRSAWIRPAAE
jgi:hypothetical protein